MGAEAARVVRWRLINTRSYWGHVAEQFYYTCTHEVITNTCLQRSALQLTRNRTPINLGLLLVNVAFLMTKVQTVIVSVIIPGASFLKEQLKTVLPVVSQYLQMKQRVLAQWLRRSHRTRPRYALCVGSGRALPRRAASSRATMRSPPIVCYSSFFASERLWRISRPCLFQSTQILNFSRYE